MAELTREEQIKRIEVLRRAGQISPAEAARRIQEIKERATIATGSGDGATAGGQPIVRFDASEYIKAPYRFVAVADQVVMPEAENKFSHTKPIPDGFCATIAVEWAAETPLLIGAEGADGTATPMTLADDTDWVIPGATIRGLLRTALETVAYSRLMQVNKHHRYGVRDFEHLRYHRFGLGDVTKVKAGWLTWRRDGSGEVYTIQPCRWEFVRITDLRAVAELAADDDEARRDWSGKKLLDKYQTVGMRSGRQVDFTKPRRLADVDAHPNAPSKRLLQPDAKGGLSGVFVFSDQLPGKGSKRYEYAFLDDIGAAFEVDREVAKVFERMYSRPSRNQPVPDGSWKLLKPLVRAGHRIPVFWAGDPSRQKPATFAFGLTRLFKVPHRFSVGEILAQWRNHLPHVTDNNYVPDFVENLFGFVHEPNDVYIETEGSQRPPVKPASLARKGRVAFSFARVAPGCRATVTQPLTTINMAARASFAPFYLQGKHKDYSASESRLAGRKRYPPRYPHDRLGQAWPAIRTALTDQAEQLNVKSDEVQSRLAFLAPAAPGQELRFQSTIRLHNVTAAELGAVLWVLTFGGDPAKPYRYLMGRGKPFGAGQVRVVSARLAVEPNQGEAPEFVKEPAADELPGSAREGYCPADGGAVPANASHRPFIAAFEAFMEQQVPGWRRNAPVTEFLASSNPAVGAILAEKGSLSYLPLADRAKRPGGSPVPVYAALRLMTKPVRQEAPGKGPLGPDRFLPASEA